MTSFKKEIKRGVVRGGRERSGEREGGQLEVERAPPASGDKRKTKLGRRAAHQADQA